VPIQYDPGWVPNQPERLEDGSLALASNWC